MPQLGEDPAARGMRGVRHRRPGLDLSVGEQPWHVVPADRIAADPHPFADDQPGRGPLGVILHMEVSGRQVLVGGARPGQGCHHQSVGQRQGSGREVVVWDVWCAESFDGIWHLDGECGNTPAPHIVREHCGLCRHLRVGYWCAECVAAYCREIAQQKRFGADEYLWCRQCNKFTLTWTT